MTFSSSVILTCSIHCRKSSRMNELSYSISLINCVDNLNELLRIGYELIYENNSKAENASCNHKI